MDDWTTLFQTAGQYYVAGRYSAFAGFIPVAGNLLHHAVEMYLKGGLSKKGYNRALIKDLGHDLERIWERFKNEYPDPALNTFDQVIPQLDRFEGIRYPGPKLDRGMCAVINIPRAITVHPLGPSPVYELCVQDIDHLVAVLFKTVSANPVAFLTAHFLQPIALDYLKKDNDASSLIQSE